MNITSLNKDKRTIPGTDDADDATYADRDQASYAYAYSVTDESAHGFFINEEQVSCLHPLSMATKRIHVHFKATASRRSR